jgi:hypothetical protein
VVCGGRKKRMWGRIRLDALLALERVVYWDATVMNYITKEK